MRRVVLVLNLYNYMPPKCRDSIRAAAARWGADYIEATAPLLEHKHFFWEKLAVNRHVENEARICQLDADMLVRYDCPSPFDLVPMGSLGVVRANPKPLKHLEWITKSIAKWSHLFGPVTLEPLCDAFNSGTLVYDLPLHRFLFDRCLDDGDAAQWSDKFVVEETLLNLYRVHLGVATTWLPRLFNTCRVDLSPAVNSTGRMSTFIYHLVENNDKLLPSLQWQERSESAMLEWYLQHAPQGEHRLAIVGDKYGELASRTLSYRRDVKVWWSYPWAMRSHHGCQRANDDAYKTASRNIEFAGDRVSRDLCGMLPPRQRDRELHRFKMWGGEIAAERSCDVVLVDREMANRRNQAKRLCKKGGKFACETPDGSLELV